LHSRERGRGHPPTKPHIRGIQFSFSMIGVMLIEAPGERMPSGWRLAMCTRNYLVVSLVAASMLGAVSVHAADKKLTHAQLPPAVQKGVDEQSQGATVSGFSEEREHGKTFYEAEMKVNGHSKDMLFDGDGKVVEIEEEVAMDLLPAEVKAGLQAKAGSGKIGKVESLTKQGKLVAYEAKVMTNGKRSEIQVGPDGKPLDHEE
jgi:hypothetical protein